MSTRQQPERRIAPLPAEVVDRIAAGEVIERPASVVRELVENALDAGAHTIRVEAREGGLRLLRVADDGCGMDAADLALACQPHTTSKLRTLGDLDAVTTLGFRGEALASILAAGQLELTSAADNSGLAHTLDYAPGHDATISASSRPRGTTVAVRALFQALPARRAMFARAGAETARIFATVRRYALVRPDVRFTFIADGHLVAQTPGDNLAGAVGALYGADAARALLALGEHSDHSGRCTGAVGGRDFTFTSREHILLAVNGRPVQHRPLLAAIEAGYRPLLRKGRHPLVIAHVKVPPERMDANIHPAKAEVLLRDEKTLTAALRAAVADVLGRTPTAPTTRWQSAIGVPPPALPLTLRFPPVRRRRGLRLGERRAGYDALWRAAVEEPLAQSGLPLRALAQLDDVLILAATSNGDLVLVDQHRAHERVLYERLVAVAGRGGGGSTTEDTEHAENREDAWAANVSPGEGGELAAPIPPMRSGTPRAPSDSILTGEARQAAAQFLLEPLLIELTPRQTHLLTPRLSELATLGIECQPFGGSTFLVRSLTHVPGAAHGIAEEIGALLAEAAEDAEDWRDHVAIGLACRSAVRRGRPLSQAEQQTLLDELAEVIATAVCPHGSPLLVRLGREWLMHTFAW